MERSENFRKTESPPPPPTNAYGQNQIKNEYTDLFLNRDLCGNVQPAHSIWDGFWCQIYASKSVHP